MTGLPLAGVWLVFLTGLAGGFGHCVAMCGPITGALGFSGGAAARGPGGAALFQLGYQAGRLASYTLIGVALGALGSARLLAAFPGVALLPAQRFVGVAAGALMVLMGLAILGVPGLTRVARFAESGAGLAGTGWFGRAVGRVRSWGAWGAIPLGMLTGLLPCGLLMTIELRALGSGSALLGGVTMLAFGLGTVPALAAFGVASGLLGAGARGWILRAGAVLVIVLGVLTIANALRLVAVGA